MTLRRSEIPSGSAHRDSLDGLRGVAVLLVLLHHFGPIMLDRTPGSLGAYFGVAFGFGYVGVDLFFVLSGYFVGGIVMDRGTEPLFARRFYLRRGARILPLMFLAITVLSGAHQLGWYGPAPAGGPPWSALVYGAGLTNFWMAASADWGFRPLSPLWSLAIEIQFYLTAPLLAWGRSLHTPLVLFALIGSCALIRVGLLTTGMSSLAVALLPFSRMDSFCCGVFVAWIVRAPHALRWCRDHRRLLDIFLGGAAVACLFLLESRAANGGVVMCAGGYTLVSVGGALALLRLETAPQGFAQRVLCRAPLAWLGRRSYFIYLFQGFVIALVTGCIARAEPWLTAAASPLQLLAGFAVLCVFAEGSWRSLESPILRRVGRPARRTTAPAICV